jgi:hypothetical protein
VIKKLKAENKALVDEQQQRPQAVKLVSQNDS